jgi:hypothetical protein
VARWRHSGRRPGSRGGSTAVGLGRVACRQGLRFGGPPVGRSLNPTPSNSPARVTAAPIFSAFLRPLHRREVLSVSVHLPAGGQREMLGLIKKGKQNKSPYCFQMNGIFKNSRGLKDLVKHLHITDSIRECFRFCCHFGDGQAELLNKFSKSSFRRKRFCLGIPPTTRVFRWPISRSPNFYYENFG